MSGEITPTEAEGYPTKGKIERMIERVEMMALQKGENIDLSVLNDTQRDKILEVMQINEMHAFQYHSKKLDGDKEVKLARIQAGTIIQKSNRDSTLLLILGTIVITLCILFFKDAYLSVWLSFITGLAGGYGISKLQKSETHESGKDK